MPKTKHSTSAKLVTLRFHLRLNSANKKSEWKELRKYIEKLITEHVDLSPTSKSASHQGANIDKVKAQLFENKASYFIKGVPEVHNQVLDGHIMKRINQLRFNNRHKCTDGDAQSTKSRDDSVPETPRSYGEDADMSAISERKPSPYMPRPKKVETRIFNPPSDDEGQSPRSVLSSPPSAFRRNFSSTSSSFAQRISEAAANHVRFYVDGTTSTPSPFRETPYDNDEEDLTHITTPQSSVTAEVENSTSNGLPGPMSLPLRDIHPLDPRLIIPPQYEEEPMQIGPDFGIAPPPVAPAPIPINEGLMAFLKFVCQRPIPHLYPDLVAFGCESMQEIQIMSQWSFEILDGVLREMKGRAVGGRGVTKPIDWHILAYAIRSFCEIEKGSSTGERMVVEQLDV